MGGSDVLGLSVKRKITVSSTAEYSVFWCGDLWESATSCLWPMSSRRGRFTARASPMSTSALHFVPIPCVALACPQGTLLLSSKANTKSDFSLSQRIAQNLAMYGCLIHSDGKMEERERG